MTGRIPRVWPPIQGLHWSRARIGRPVAGLREAMESGTEHQVGRATESRLPPTTITQRLGQGRGKRRRLFEAKKKRAQRMSAAGDLRVDQGAVNTLCIALLANLSATTVLY